MGPAFCVSLVGRKHHKETVAPSAGVEIRQLTDVLH
jgi:hypothetical protein